MSNQETGKMTKLGKEHELADIMHERMCNYDHTDGCVWYDDKGDLSQYFRQKYLKKAKDVLSVVDFETAKKVFIAAYEPPPNYKP